MANKMPLMIGEPALRGYLLEEALAWLLRNSGYRLLTADDQDRQLVTNGNTLRVQGRGAQHQVDVLGQFALTPAFSLPIRMFIEAKFRRQKSDLPDVRNAHGVVHDINENFVSIGNSRPRRRYFYAYALFSTSGFTEEAQAYALAQQISLVDLSGHSFEWLRTAVRTTAKRLHQWGVGRHSGSFHIGDFRQSLRAPLGTPVEPQPVLYQRSVEKGSRVPFDSPDTDRITQGFVDALGARNGTTELLLGFPAAPFILTLHADDPQRFIQYADRHPAHRIQLRRTSSGKQAEWSVSPQGDPGSYRLAFDLPDRVELWIEDNDRERIQFIKMQFLPHTAIYRQDGNQTKIYQLLYQPGELRRASR